MFHYRAYGLAIASGVPIARLPEVPAGPADVTIAMLAVDEDLPDTRFDSGFANWRAGPGVFLLSVDGVADYLVRDGREVLIRPAPGAQEDSIMAFLLGSAFAAVLQQRGFLTLHASAIMSGGGATLFVGHSGIGKSTTLAAMCARGHRMVTDDIAAVRLPRGSAPAIVPSFPGGKLTAKSLECLGETSESYERLHAEIEKFAYPLDLVGEGPVGIERVAILESWEQDGFSRDLLSRAEAFEATSFFTFRKRFYDGMGLQRSHFDMVTRLVAQVPVIRIRRPARGLRLEELVDLLEVELLDQAAGKAAG